MGGGGINGVDIQYGVLVSMLEHVSYCRENQTTAYRILLFSQVCLDVTIHSRSNRTVGLHTPQHEGVTVRVPVHILCWGLSTNHA
jgi:hypothetical protein